MSVDANFFVTVPDAGGSDDFHTGKFLTVNYNYYLLPWLGLTSGFFASEEILDNVQADIVGRYQASFKTQGMTVGVRTEHNFSKRNGVYARLGLLLYDTRLTVEEYFAAGLPAGSRSATTNGYGYFIAFGWAHSLTQKLQFQLELANQTQLNLFEGKTDAKHVFDLRSSGLSVGLAYVF
ncbi:MAG: hypothetical protein ACC707_15055 [Thiohalomonadales bacterium]